LALALVAGTVPGVIAGSSCCPARVSFDLVVAAVLLPLGTWLALTQPARGTEPGRPARAIPAPVLAVLAAAVGCVGGIYGSASARSWPRS
jgi:uncharacterized protein